MNQSKSFGQQKSHSQSEQKLGKDLMSVDEIGVMDGSKCILQVRGERPFFSNKFDIEKHKNYRYLADHDKRHLFDVKKYITKQMLGKSGKMSLRPNDTYTVVEFKGGDTDVA